MTLDEWLEKEKIGRFGEGRFRQWLAQSGYNLSVVRSESEWKELWAKFVENILV